MAKWQDPLPIGRGWSFRSRSLRRSPASATSSAARALRLSLGVQTAPGCCTEKNVTPHTGVPWLGNPYTSPIVGINGLNWNGLNLPRIFRILGRNPIYYGYVNWGTPNTPLNPMDGETINICEPQWCLQNSACQTVALYHPQKRNTLCVWCSSSIICFSFSHGRSWEKTPGEKLRNLAYSSKLLRWNRWPLPAQRLSRLYDIWHTPEPWVTAFEKSINFKVRFQWLHCFHGIFGDEFSLSFSISMQRSIVFAKKKKTCFCWIRTVIPHVVLLEKCGFWDEFISFEVTHGYPWSFTMSRPAHSIERWYFFSEHAQFTIFQPWFQITASIFKSSKSPFLGWVVYLVYAWFVALFRSLHLFASKLFVSISSCFRTPTSRPDSKPPLRRHLLRQRDTGTCRGEKEVECRESWWINCIQFCVNYESIMNLCVLAICTAFSNAISHEGYPLKFCSSAIFLENESGQIDCCYHGLSSFPLSHWSPNIPGLPCLKHQSCHHLACMLWIVKWHMSSFFHPFCQIGNDVM